MNQIKEYIVIGNKIINNQDQQNGNTQLNQIRSELKDRTYKKKFLGSTPRVHWNNSRRYRTIQL